MSFFARPLTWQALRKTGRLIALAGAVLVTGSVQARELDARDLAPADRGTASLADVSIVELPAEAQRTYRLVMTGGPFASRKDGSVFGNRERVLPRKSRGFYREYTVPTPGARDRGARRIVCGGNPPTTPEACFYTADHYTTFRRVVQ